MGTWYYAILLKDDKRKLIVAKYIGTNTHVSDEEDICRDVSDLLYMPEYYYLCKLGITKVYSEDRLYDYYEDELGYKVIVVDKEGIVHYPEEIERVLIKNRFRERR